MTVAKLAGVVAFVLLVLALASVAIWAPGPRAPTESQRPVATATVTRGTLVETAVAQGTLAYGPAQALESRLTGTVTGLAPVGSVVDRGRALFRIDDRPVILLVGALPAYRDLTAGQAATPPPAGAGTGSGPADGAAVPATKGADVRQFEENLKALGYSGFTVDDDYTVQTATVVRHWQKDLGLPQTGVVELGRVFYAAGPIRVAEQKLAVGVVAAGPVLSYTGTARVVTAKVPSRHQASAKAHTAVTVALSSGRNVAATVQSVGTPVAPDAGAGPEPMLDVVVSLDDPTSLNGLDDGPARVILVIQQRPDVLMVPVGALLALAEGGYGLQVIQAGSSEVVAVTTGLFADGSVEVSGPDVQEGMVVGMAR